MSDMTKELKELKSEYNRNREYAQLYENAYRVEPTNKDFRMKLFEYSFLQADTERRAFKTLLREIENKFPESRQIIDDFKSFWYLNDN